MTFFRQILAQRILPGISFLYGVASLIFLLALVANVPILQFASFGYLLESAGRLGRGRSLGQSIPGRPQAARIFTIILCCWLLLLPIRVIAGFWFDAWLIDPGSNQTRVLRAVQVVLTVVALSWIVVALTRGGRFRDFLWPFASVWHRLPAWWRTSDGKDQITVGKLGPRTARLKSAYREKRDQVYDFFTSLKVGYLFRVGLLGVIGTLLWLIVPMTLLIAAGQPDPAGDGRPGLIALFALLLAVPAFCLLPFLQIHFAVKGKLNRFLQVRQVWQNFGRAPLAHLLALFLTYALAIPLFLLKIETVPSEFFWLFSIVFIVFIWPAKLICGWAWRRGQRKTEPARWWVRIPARLLALVLALVMVGDLFVGRYILWNGSDTVFENHMFLMPTPFWL